MHQKCRRDVISRRESLTTSHKSLDDQIKIKRQKSDACIDVLHRTMSSNGESSLGEGGCCVVDCRCCDGNGQQ